MVTIEIQSKDTVVEYWKRYYEYFILDTIYLSCFKTFFNTRCDGTHF